MPRAIRYRCCAAHTHLANAILLTDTEPLSRSLSRSPQLLVEISSLQLAVVSIEAAQAHLANFLIQARRFDQVTIAEYMNTLISCKDPKAFATYFNVRTGNWLAFKLELTLSLSLSCAYPCA